MTTRQRQIVWFLAIYGLSVGALTFSGAAHPDVIAVDNLVRWSPLNGKQRNERESS